MNFILRYRIRVHNLRNRKRRYEARNFELSSSKFRILLLFTILSTHPYVVSIPLIRILEPDFIYWIIIGIILYPEIFLSKFYLIILKFLKFNSEWREEVYS